MEKFDVFLCHNSQDKPAVIEIANQLKANNINPWLDKWHLRPGSSWQDLLEDQINEIRTAAVFVGNSGLGPWQNEEIKAFIRAFVNRKCPVIPVLLPNAPQKPQIPLFLEGLMWVDFRQRDPEPLGQLIWGITGIKPDLPPLILEKLPAEKNKSPYQLKTFQFQTAQINNNGTEINRISKTAEYFAQDLGNGVNLEMVAIPGGTFIMGSPENEEGYHSSQSPQHQVTVPPFFMGKYPVTQQQWRVVAALPKVNIDLKSDPSLFKGDNLPVERVSWNDAQEFCARLSRMANKTYRLPTEAEWEYACRGGTTTPFYCGETISTDLANYNGNYTYGQGQKGEYREKTTEVGIFPANPFGLYDMCGNVWEWCEDGWHKNYINAPIDGSAWTSLSSTRALRGGSWIFNPQICRSASRISYIRGVRDLIIINIGFRVVCVVGRIIR
ncbi:MAG: SUMF1/EgtB/PvdO family nonheme iron enzyme [Dolichospermum circinale Clear-D4]|nr:SUMF1/EgtB/PvdO family nonheme iron enzyme [Dolichospermum circinale Clear-D4]